MLIRFDSDVGGFNMFGDVAVRLLKLAGHSGTVPGAILAEDVAPAAERLRAALEAGAGPSAAPARDDGEDDDDEPPVSLRQRAFPLLELLDGAARNDSNVRWRQA